MSMCIWIVFCAKFSIIIIKKIIIRIIIGYGDLTQPTQVETRVNLS